MRISRIHTHTHTTRTQTHRIKLSLAQHKCGRRTRTIYFFMKSNNPGIVWNFIEATSLNGPTNANVVFIFVSRVNRCADNIIIHDVWLATIVCTQFRRRIDGKIG